MRGARRRKDALKSLPTQMNPKAVEARGLATNLGVSAAEPMTLAVQEMDGRARRLYWRLS